MPGRTRPLAWLRASLSRRWGATARSTGRSDTFRPKCFRDSWRTTPSFPWCFSCCWAILLAPQPLRSSSWQGFLRAVVSVAEAEIVSRLRLLSVGFDVLFAFNSAAVGPW